MKKEKDNQSLKSQSIWLLTAKIVGFALSFFLPLIIVRSLSQEAVGHYREAFLVIMNAVVILPLGLSMSAYYFLGRETERRGAAIFNILLFNFVVGGLAEEGGFLGAGDCEIARACSRAKLIEARAAEVGGAGQVDGGHQLFSQHHRR
ncbi:MAG: hypothetical protein ABL959_23475, partial [Pyrinomonadaceae bacterium]